MTPDSIVNRNIGVVGIISTDTYSLRYRPLSSPQARALVPLLGGVRGGLFPSWEGLGVGYSPPGSS